MDTAVIDALTNLGFGGLIVLLIVLDVLVPRGAYARVLRESARKDEVITRLETALALERQRADDVTKAGTVTNQLITGLVQLAGGHHPDGMAPAAITAPGQTGKDAGL